ncbi:MAG: hypothetical protein KAJ86_05800 [Alphaproteobacteria bacterium]|nr:hypothetical protein [Alphaproteobacteria bacterium]
MLVFLLLCFIATLTTLIIKRNDMEIPPFGTKEILRGEVASSLGDVFEEKLIIKDHVVGLWGAINYGLFKTGSKKVVIGKDDWLFTVEEFQLYDNAHQATTRKIELAKKINEYLSEKNIQLAVLIIPSKARIYPEFLGRHKIPDSRQNIYNHFYNEMISLGIPSPDLALHYKEEKTKSNTQLYMRLDTHWTPEGAQIAADILSDIIDKTKLDRTVFKKIISGTEQREGDLEKYIPTGIFSKWLAPAQEEITLWNIKETGDDTLEAIGLFGEENIPVALIGTSYSAIKEWNFEGALKTALQADILNLADEGKGPLDPMAAFLEDTDFNTTTIKLVIWEIPERFISVSYKDVVFPEFIEERK